MKKLIYFLSLLFVFGIVADAKVIEVPNAVAGTMIIGGGVPSGGGGTTYPDIICYWDADSSTNTKGSGDTSWSLDWGAVIDSSLKKIGTASCNYPSSGDVSVLSIASDDYIDPTSGRVGFYVYVTTWVTGMNFFRAYYDSSNQISFEWYGSSMALRYIAGGSTVTLYSGWTPSTSTWYYVELIWDTGGTNTLEVKVDGTSKNTSSSALGTISSGSGEIDLGIREGVSGDINIDQFLSSDDPSRDLNAIKDLTSFPDS